MNSPVRTDFLSKRALRAERVSSLAMDSLSTDWVKLPSEYSAHGKKEQKKSKKILPGTAAMTDKLWLLPFGPDQIHLPTLHSPDSAGFLMPVVQIASGFIILANFTTA